MTGPAPLAYDRAAERVQDMIGQGTPFAQVEDAIETAAAPQEHKAALWLLAWSLRELVPKPRDSRLRLGSVGALQVRTP